MYKFKIEGLSCMGCFNKIEDSLKKFDSQIVASPDVQNKTLSIETTHSVEHMTRIIATAGYVAKDITKG